MPTDDPFDLTNRNTNVIQQDSNANYLETHHRTFLPLQPSSPHYNRSNDTVSSDRSIDIDIHSQPLKCIPFRALHSPPHRMLLSKTHLDHSNSDVRLMPRSILKNLCQCQLSSCHHESGCHASGCKCKSDHRAALELATNNNSATPSSVPSNNTAKGISMNTRNDQTKTVKWSIGDELLQAAEFVPLSDEESDESARYPYLFTRAQRLEKKKEWRIEWATLKAKGVDSKKAAIGIGPTSANITSSSSSPSFQPPIDEEEELLDERLRVADRNALTQLGESLHNEKSLEVNIAVLDMFTLVVACLLGGFIVLSAGDSCQRFNIKLDTKKRNGKTLQTNNGTHDIVNGIRASSSMRSIAHQLQEIHDSSESSSFANLDLPFSAPAIATPSNAALRDDQSSMSYPMNLRRSFSTTELNRLFQTESLRSNGVRITTPIQSKPEATVALTTSFSSNPRKETNTVRPFDPSFPSNAVIDLTQSISQFRNGSSIHNKHARLSTLANNVTHGTGNHNSTNVQSGMPSKRRCSADKDIPSDSMFVDADSSEGLAENPSHVVKQPRYETNHHSPSKRIIKKEMKPLSFSIAPSSDQASIPSSSSSTYPPLNPSTAVMDLWHLSPSSSVARQSVVKPTKYEFHANTITQSITPAVPQGWTSSNVPVLPSMQPSISPPSTGQNSSYAPQPMISYSNTVRSTPRPSFRTGDSFMSRNDKEKVNGLSTSKCMPKPSTKSLIVSAGTAAHIVMEKAKDIISSKWRHLISVQLVQNDTVYYVCSISGCGFQLNSGFVNNHFRAHVLQMHPEFKSLVSTSNEFHTIEDGFEATSSKSRLVNANASNPPRQLATSTLPIPQFQPSAFVSSDDWFDQMSHLESHLRSHSQMSCSKSHVNDVVERQSGVHGGHYSLVRIARFEASKQLQLDSISEAFGHRITGITAKTQESFPISQENSHQPLKPYPFAFAK